MSGDDGESRLHYVDEFLHSLFAIIGACLEEGDDAEVSVNGIRIITFSANPIEDALEDVVSEDIEQYNNENVFDLAAWQPKGDKN